MLASKMEPSRKRITDFIVCGSCRPLGFQLAMYFKFYFQSNDGPGRIYFLACSSLMVV